ncbi:MAG: hypothetical protein HRU24_13260 [Gammaproteobacteria bacterium]|nr:hypothetical protein [Gammaproteobacteria bacterium]
MKIKLIKMVDDYYGGSRKLARESLVSDDLMSPYAFNNLISQDRDVMRLESGDFILVTSKSKVFKVN